MGDFDRIFDPQYATVDLFTNRMAEKAAFAGSVVHHGERIAEGAAVLANVARHHVLTFYGIGGIGKTELSRRLECWILGELSESNEWGAPPHLHRPVRSVRIDFHGSSTVHTVDIVLRLRAALADAGGRYPAFDVGLAAWWALAHPGATLPDLRSSSGFDVRGQINDTLSEVLNEVGASFGVGPLTVRTGRLVIDAVRARRIRTKALHGCGPLASIVEQARLNPSPYVAASLAGLLSWDYERLSDEQKPLLVAFADAAEYVQGGDRGQERLFNRIVHLTPGILWVVTSRRALDWDSISLTTQLPAVGPAIWPGLGLGMREEPCQHLVGDLSDADVERFLQAASGAGGNPSLSSEVRDRIRQGAHGLPLYLDLSLAIARAAGGVELDPHAFGGPLPQLVARVFADLPAQEHKIARTASLVARFDSDMLAKATDGLLGDALRFCEKALVSYDGHPMFPYRLHDAVREAIINEPPSIPGAWAPGDRRDRAAALAEVLRTRHKDCLDSVEQRLEIIEIAARLCADHDLAIPWLLETTLDLPGIEQTAGRLPPPSDDTWIGLVASFLNAWRGRTVRQRVAYLAEYTGNSLPTDIRRSAQRWLAYSLRSLNDYSTALEIFRELLAEDPDSQLIRYQTALTLRSLGRYPELREHMETYPVTGEGRDLRLLAELAFDRAEFQQAIAGPAARASYLRSLGKHRLALENDRTVLWRKALIGQASIADCDAIAEEGDRYGMPFTYRSALAARLLCLPASDPRVAETQAELASFIEDSGGAAGWREFTAGLVQALRRVDHAAVAEIRGRWTAAYRPWTPEDQLIDRICIFAGHSPVLTVPGFEGGLNGDEIDRRWQAVIAALTHPDAGASA
ncbi:hypothetical protein AB0H37_34935 [Actinomadura sp. NPDC023710]|uniref:hypothetical protein n=1 Tax=Actinomadura sp. NPDC023710 TaxID=3158219 RepID=UPI0033F20481